MYPKGATDFSAVEYVFLDRDGVLNRKPPPGGFVTHWQELELLPGVQDAVAELNRSSRKVIVVTNQRGVALGLYSMEDLAEIHERMQAQLAAGGARLDGIYVCPHEAGQCSCRKPLTGLFEQAFHDFPAACAENSVMVGDSLRDIEAGHRLGMRTILVTGGMPLSGDPELTRAKALADLCALSLPDFVNRYLAPQSA